MILVLWLSTNRELTLPIIVVVGQIRGADALKCFLRFIVVGKKMFGFNHKIMVKV